MNGIEQLINSGGISEALPKLQSLLENNKEGDKASTDNKQVEPNLGKIHYLTAFCLHNLRIDSSKALHHYNLALESGFDEFWVRYNRGFLYRELANIDAARADLERAVSINPDHNAAKQYLEDIKIEEIQRLVDNEQLSEALPKLQSLLENNKEGDKASTDNKQVEPKLGKIHYLTAFCLHNLRIDSYKALHHYNLALESGFDEFWVRYNRGSLYAELANIYAARADLERAVSINPDHNAAKQYLEDISPTAGAGDEQLKLASPVLVCSIPKSGTMLLHSILLSILGDDLVVPSKYFKIPLASSDYILNLPELTNRVYVGHIWYSDDIAKKLSSIPKILLIRDPRDVAVSNSYFLGTTAFLDTLQNESIRKQWQEYWNGLQPEDKLSAVIFGMPTPNHYPPSILSAYLNYAIQWTGPLTFIVRFEDIVGSGFGGDDNKVINTINSILNFIGVRIDKDTLSRKVALGASPDKSKTFRSGHTGSWRQEFKSTHASQIKTVAPGLVSALGYEQDENWNLQTPPKKISETINIDKEKFSAQILDMNRYIQLRKESSGKIERLIDEWALDLFIQAKQFTNALSVLKRLLTSNPNYSSWNYLYGLCLQKEKNVNNYSSLNYLYGLCLQNEKKEDEWCDKALHHYNIALQNGFDEFELKYARSIVLAIAGNLPAALNDISRALMLKPQSLTAKERLDLIKKLEVTCRNTQVLPKNAPTTTKTFPTGNQRDRIVDKSKEETDN